MKTKILFIGICLCLVYEPLLLSQNSSGKEYKIRENVLRIHQSIAKTNIEYDTLFERSIKEIDDIKKFELKDSVRRYLRKNQIFDYDIEGVEIDKNFSNESLTEIKAKQSKLYQKLKDTLFNKFALSYLKNNKQYLFFSKHYIDFNNDIEVRIHNKDFINSNNYNETIIIRGKTELDNLSFCSFDQMSNVELDTPIEKKLLIKKGKLFEIELDVSRTNSKDPFKVTIVDEKGKILSQINLTNK